MDLGLGKDKQQALGEEAGKEGKQFLKSARNGIIAAGNEFGEDTKDGADWFGEKVLGVDYDKTHDGPNENGKTYRQVRDEEKQNLSEEQTRLEEESPYKDIYEGTKDKMYDGLNKIALLQAAHSLPILAKEGLGVAKQGIGILKEGISFGKTELANLGKWGKAGIANLGKEFESLGANSKKVTGKLSQEVEEMINNLKKHFKGAGKAEIYTDDMRKYIVPTEDGFDALLERKYIEIRKEGFDDVSKVAENTGLSKQDMIDMKKHIFLNRHTLSIKGKPYEELYFQADSDIAYAWQKAQKEKLVDQDEIDWFKALRNHELTEKRIMEEEGLPLRDQSTWNPDSGFDKDASKNAHDKANETDECPSTFPEYKKTGQKEFEDNWDKDPNNY